MKLLLVLLDGVTLGPVLAMGFLFVVLPVAALVLLIYLFIKKKNRNK